MRTLIRPLASLYITLTSLSVLFILVLFGTFAQVNYGINHVQNIYFQSFFLWKQIGSLNIPYFPGGYLAGGALTINLIAFMISKMKWAWKKSGIILIHIGLLVLIIGSGLTGLLQKESQLILEVGDTSNYTEDFYKKEIAISQVMSPTETSVYSFPFKGIEKGNIIQNESLPFTVSVERIHKNSTILFQDPDPAISGIGSHFLSKELPFTYDPKQVNKATALVTITLDSGSTYSMLLSEEINRPQEIIIDGIPFGFELRRIRYYTPYSIQLNSFTHDKYLGTNIPKNFSSHVTLTNPKTGEVRDTDIYMNHPLRYEGKTYYQASFGKQDTVSIFQVVENPTWLWPYISTLIMTIGLCLHFFIMTMQRRKRDS